MHWNYAIERNRGLLIGVLTGLFGMIGLTEDAMVERVSRPVYRKVHRVLRSVESAVRRLIIASARDLVVEPALKRPAPMERSAESQRQDQGNQEVKARRKRGLFFSLFDRPRRQDWGIPGRRKTRKIEPRISILGSDPRIPWFLRPQAPGPAPVPGKDRAVGDGTVDATRLCRRLLAAMDALEDLARQARRYARWRNKPLEKRRPRRESPLRLGWPPGWRIRPTHEVDEILKDCHWLARSALTPDTS
ncbi:MAG: hypothetical protein U1E67_23010 [Hyphomicrobiales bacterium]